MPCSSPHRPGPIPSSCSSARRRHGSRSWCRFATGYGTLCGWTLARAHARSGDRVAIAGYLGAGDSFDRAIVEFSKAYAEQNERDYRALDAAVKSGRIAARTGL